MTEGQSGPRRRVLTFLLVVLFSAFFFAEASLRASQKFFWFDELCSLAIVQLPTFHDSWQAVLHGADFNPPLFYVIMRWTHSCLGDGLIAQRIPAMLGIWCLCLSLGFVAWRRSGRAAGVTALLFPLATTAAYYAAEARPHALVLGFIGLSIVCWQRLGDGGKSLSWLLAFSSALLAALLTHCYALLSVFPFVAFESVRAFRERKLRTSVWVPMLLPLLIAIGVYIPLFQAYRANLAGTGFAYQFRSGFWQLAPFYAGLLNPAILVLVATVVLFAVPHTLLRPFSNEAQLALAFAGMPVAAVVFCLLIRGPFISRYFLAATAGFALLLAFGTAAQAGWRRLVLPLLLIAMLLRGFSGMVWHRLHGQAEIVMEPVVDIPVNTMPGKPLARYTPLLKETGTTLPIVIAKPLDFLYLVHYAPQLRPRLYYVADSVNETNYRLYNNVRKWCHLDYHAPETYSGFLPGHPHFYLWGDPAHLNAVAALTKQGAQIEQWDSNSELYLAKLRMPH